MAKRNIKLDVDSLFDAMREAYRDCDEQKKAILEKISERTTKAKPEDFQDELELARYFNESRKVLNDVIDKKIKLIQIHAKVIGTGKINSEKEGQEVQDMSTLSQDDIAKLRENILKDMEQTNTYDLSL
jgi:hypothetical protein